MKYYPNKREDSETIDIKKTLSEKKLANGDTFLTVLSTDNEVYGVVKDGNDKKARKREYKERLQKFLGCPDADKITIGFRTNTKCYTQ